jgi:hypothetical protein
MLKEGMFYIEMLLITKFRLFSYWFDNFIFELPIKLHRLKAIG